MEKYQDFVIKDGKFIGEFEKMYQKFDDPWHQQEVIKDSYSRLNTVLTLKNIHARHVLEVGCGLGVFTNYLSQELSDISVSGMDISETAIERARDRYPDLTFVVGDLKNINKYLSQSDYEYDVIIFSELIWYILTDIKVILNKIKQKFEGYLIINQTFYKRGQQYGTEFFTNLEEMISYLDLNLIGCSVADMQHETNSYETHSLFRL